MAIRTSLFATLAAFSGALCVLGALAVLDPGLRDRLARRLLFGGPLVEIRAPHPEQWVAQGGVDIVLRYPDASRTAPETLRCLLNGREVTSLLTLAENGAAGSVIGAVSGENLLRVQVFGRPWWGRIYLEDTVELVFYVRPLPSFDRA